MEGIEKYMEVLAPILVDKHKLFAKEDFTLERACPLVGGKGRVCVCVCVCVMSVCVISV